VKRLLAITASAPLICAAFIACTSVPPPTPAPVIAPAPASASASAPVLASASASGAAAAPAPCTDFVELTRDGKTTRLTDGCFGWRPLPGPYAEILDPDGDTRFVVEACDAVTRFDIVGWTKKLPGSLASTRLRIGVRNDTREIDSEAADVSVTTFGAVGQPIEGTFRATMRPRFNGSPETVSGRFHICRGPDRYPP
jgi:hypothetical protein